MTLRLRLALLFGVLALVVGAVVGVAGFRATRGELTAATDRFLDERAGELIGGRRPAPDRNRDRPIVDARGASDADAIVQTIRPDGSIGASIGGELPITSAAASIVGRSSGFRSGTSRFEDIEIDGEPHRLLTRSVASGAAIQVARSTAEDASILQQLGRRYFLIALVAAGLAALLAYTIARRVTEPLQRLDAAASHVARTGDVTATPLVDDDIPERRDEIGSLASSFRSMLDALATSREQQRRLVADAGHELRTPLTSLRANVALLARAETSERGLSDEDRREVLDAIGSELGELGGVFDELIELAADGADRDAPFAEVALDEVVERAVARWERRLDRPVEATVEAATVTGNEAMLERAIDNLIANAHKFSPPGTSIEVRASGGSVVVSDHGPGIAPADRQRVFDRFYRADLSRPLPGSGLGLAIVAQIVEQHRGTVRVGESPSGGAEVGFRLPTR